ncbi:MAG: DUF2199 domain-containing protein [Blastocatellia bacterium]
MSRYFCSSCGEFHDDLPLSYGADAPYWYDVLAPEERDARAAISSDECVIDDKHFFIRGLVEIPIVGSAEKFSWGVWVSLSESNFDRACELWNDPARVFEPAFFGWLSTNLPGYPQTLNLKALTHSQAVGQRPLIELEPTDHPLSVEQRNGITMDRVKEIAEMMLQGH